MFILEKTHPTYFTYKLIINVPDTTIGSSSGAPQAGDSTEMGELLIDD